MTQVLNFKFWNYINSFYSFSLINIDTCYLASKIFWRTYNLYFKNHFIWRSLKNLIGNSQLFHWAFVDNLFKNFILLFMWPINIKFPWSVLRIIGWTISSKQITLTLMIIFANCKFNTIIICPTRIIALLNRFTLTYWNSFGYYFFLKTKCFR